MPNIGPLELIIVLVIVLLIFGPKRLPGLGVSSARACASSRTPSPARTDARRGWRRPALERGERAAAPLPPTARRDRAAGRAPSRAPDALKPVATATLRPVGHEDRLSARRAPRRAAHRLIICGHRVRASRSAVCYLAERPAPADRQPAAAGHQPQKRTQQGKGIRSARSTSPTSDPRRAGLQTRAASGRSRRRSSPRSAQLLEREAVAGQARDVRRG